LSTLKNLMEVGIELCPEEARAERGRTRLSAANQNASFIPSGLGWTHLSAANQNASFIPSVLGWTRLSAANGRGPVQDRKVRTRLRLANQE
jgi:hypothetical protein